MTDVDETLSLAFEPVGEDNKRLRGGALYLPVNRPFDTFDHVFDESIYTDVRAIQVLLFRAAKNTSGRSESAVSYTFNLSVRGYSMAPMILPDEPRGHFQVVHLRCEDSSPLHVFRVIFVPIVDPDSYWLQFYSDQTGPFRMPIQDKNYVSRFLPKIISLDLNIVSYGHGTQKEYNVKLNESDDEATEIELDNPGTFVYLALDNNILSINLETAVPDFQTDKERDDFFETTKSMPFVRLYKLMYKQNQLNAGPDYYDVGESEILESFANFLITKRESDSSEDETDPDSDEDF